MTEISRYLLFGAFLNAADRNPLFRLVTRRVIVKTLVSRRKFRRATQNVCSIMKSHGNKNEERRRLLFQREIRAIRSIFRFEFTLRMERGEKRELTFHEQKHY